MSEEEEANALRLKKQKCVILFAYLGAGYAGMQFNPGQRTLESELEAALVKAGGISADNANTPSKVGWSRAARTDKGVSAVGQLVALKLMQPHKDMPAAINAHLPPVVRVFGVQRVTAAFEARRLCDRRRYEYVLPVWVALGRKAAFPAATSEEVESARQRMHGILQAYKGTHNFHNFTAGVSAREAAAKRYMQSLTCDAVLHIQGQDWLQIRIVGQSFMLHQIRKMVQLATAILRGTAPAEAIPVALNPAKDVAIPMAPNVGLFLDSCIFQAYNERWAQQLEAPVSIDAYAAQAADFKAQHLYPHIAQRDAAEGLSMAWARNLDDPRNSCGWARQPGPAAALSEPAGTFCADDAQAAKAPAKQQLQQQQAAQNAAAEQPSSLQNQEHASSSTAGLLTSLPLPVVLPDQQLQAEIAAQQAAAGSGPAKRKAAMTQDEQRKRPASKLNKRLTPAVRHSVDAELSD